MKAFITTILLTLMYSAGFSQVFQVNQGHCDKKDIEIISGNAIPQDQAIMQMGTFDKSEVEGTLEGLTKKQIKTMKQYASWRDACKVFISFEQIQTFERYTPGAEYYEDKVCFYVLVPIWEVEMK